MVDVMHEYNEFCPVIHLKQYKPVHTNKDLIYVLYITLVIVSIIVSFFLK